MGIRSFAIDPGGGHSPAICDMHDLDVWTHSQGRSRAAVTIRTILSIHDEGTQH